MPIFSHFSVCVCTGEILSGIANSVTFRSQHCSISVASRKVQEGEYIIDNTFTYEVSLLL